VSRGQFQRLRELARTEANGDTLGILEPFKTEFYSLIYKSINKNTWTVCQHAKNTLEDFRQKFKLDQIWPPHITHTIMFIHHMPTDNYSAPLSSLNFSNKMHEHIDYTQSFVVQILLAVVSKTNKRNDIRKIITMSLLKQTIEALPNICSSYFEATLFASIFHYHYLAFLRIEEVVQSGISDHTLEVDAILNRLYM
jgi:hypothetical protein